MTMMTGVRLIFLPARIVLISVLIMSIPYGLQAKALKGSKHDLSVTGGGGVKSSGENQMCMFCHANHHTGQAPLWNHNASAVTYIPYTSSTMKAHPGQPTGASKLCLSCHDGTVALGSLRHRKSTVSLDRGETRMSKSRANLGTDLSDDHPISFLYDSGLASLSGGELKDPTLLNPAVHLDSNHELQCTSCHDPHSNQYDNFLVMNNVESALCLVCHDKRYWATSSHRTSTAKPKGGMPKDWSQTAGASVQDQGCGNCHEAHNAGSKARLLYYASEEDNCLVCHDGSVGSMNVLNDFTKPSAHDVRQSRGVHDPAEDLVNSSRHVECADCHNAHAVNSTTVEAPAASGSLSGVAGVDLAGAAVNPLIYEYQLCFRCHGDSKNRGRTHVSRLDNETNTRLEFNPSNGSYHPVAAPGKSTRVPSLLSPYTVASQIYCTDCHAGDKGGGSGKTPARPPHGSKWTPILEKRLVLEDGSSENEAAYALCYKCHNRRSILNNDSFPLHQKHIVDVKAACTTCHDSHGSKQATHLVNFNVDNVKPDSTGKLNYVDDGNGTGSCALTCHGKDHNQTAYPITSPSPPALGKP